MDKFFLALLSTSLVISQATLAKELPPQSVKEIAQLLNKLESSACQFSRNGSWYSALEAKAHLQKKLDYLQNKGAIDSSEQFIALAATKSSISGTAYIVKCQDSPQQPSQTWLNNELKQIRLNVVNK